MLTRHQRALLGWNPEEEMIPLGKGKAKAMLKAAAVPVAVAPIASVAFASVAVAPVAPVAPVVEVVKKPLKSILKAAAAADSTWTWTWKPMAMKPSKFPLTDVPVPYSVEFVSTWYSDISEEEEDEKEKPVTVPQVKVLLTKKQRLLARC